MRLLVLGGTAWLGREVAATAAAAGNEVVCLARGESGLPANGVRLVRADRDHDGAYDAVAEERWDAVIDVARQPGHVRRATEALASVATHFVFVSTGNVYADHSQTGTAESAALLPPHDTDEMPSMASYGAAKVACEQHVVAAFGPDRVTIARAGLIGGPGDVSDRTGYWPWRFANPASSQGAVLAPAAPDATAQVVDVRDLAAWLLFAATQHIAGAFNATGETMTLTEHLNIAREIAEHRGELITAPPEWLVAHDVTPWMGPRSLPLWTNDPESRGFTSRDSSRARDAGLAHRSLEATLIDTLAWEQAQPRNRLRRAGLPNEDECALLEELAALPR